MQPKSNHNSIYRKYTFICPFCKIHSQQKWEIHSHTQDTTFSKKDNYLLESSECQNCCESAIWHNQKMVFPLETGLPDPNKDMPQVIKDLYLEAASVYNLSRKASLALLRLAIDKLTVTLSNRPDVPLFDRIGILKSKNIVNDEITQVFDIFRIIGNEAVHPGKIEFKDEIDHRSLFEILNYIIAIGITYPGKIQKIYDDTITEDKEQAISKREDKYKNKD